MNPSIRDIAPVYAPGTERSTVTAVFPDRAAATYTRVVLDELLRRVLNDPKLAAAWKRSQKARAKLLKLNTQLLALADEIVQKQRVPWPSAS